jgi:hemophore-related protein
MLRFSSARPRLVAGGIAAGAVAAAALCGAPGSATAEPPANCTAADLARVSATVAAQTADYLSAHPDVNEFFTNLKSAQHSDVQNQVETFMDAHPQVHADLQRIRQPRIDLQNRCQWSSDDLPD